MDRRKDDTHESRNVVIFFDQWYQPVAATGAIGPPRPIHLCGVPAGLSLSSQRVRL